MAMFNSYDKLPESNVIGNYWLAQQHMPHVFTPVLICCSLSLSNVFAVHIYANVGAFPGIVCYDWLYLHSVQSWLAHNGITVHQ